MWVLLILTVNSTELIEYSTLEECTAMQQWVYDTSTSDNLSVRAECIQRPDTLEIYRRD